MIGEYHRRVSCHADYLPIVRWLVLENVDCESDGHNNSDYRIPYFYIVGRENPSQFRMLV